jgi:hypothetical protein
MSCPSAVIEGNTVSFTITDGGLGDDDLSANGSITDPGGPGGPTLAISGSAGQRHPGQRLQRHPHRQWQPVL